MPIAGLAGGAVASWLGTPQAVTVAAAIALAFTAWQAFDVLRRTARRAVATM